MSLIKSILKSTKNEHGSIVSDGIVGDLCGFISTGSYSLNALISGSIFGGIPSNKVTAIAGPSGVGKTFYALQIIKSFLDADPENEVAYFESESALTQKMMEDLNIDTSRIAFLPVTTIQQFRFQALKVLETYEAEYGTQHKDPKLLMILDSLGNLSTTKEVEDMAEGKETLDMTRAKLIRGAFRVLTLKMGVLNVPLLITNHTYDCGTAEMEVVTDTGTSLIKDLKIGDIVMTSNGFEPVISTTKHLMAPVTDITMDNGDVLSFTAGHRFMVKSEWKYVEDLVEGDEIDLSNDDWSKIKKIEHNIRKSDVYDISTKSNDYVLKGGYISHNTMEKYAKRVMGGGCLVAGTEILMSDNTRRPIESVLVGEEVLTQNGPCEVLQTHNFEDKKVYKVQFSDGHVIECSSEHKFLTTDGDWMTITEINDSKEELDFVTIKNSLKIVKIEEVKSQQVFDITVDKESQYVLSNGVVSHNSGLTYAASTVIFLYKSKEKVGTDVVGALITARAEKSRLTKEQQKVPTRLHFESGLDKYYGLTEIAISTGVFKKVSTQVVLPDDKKVFKARIERDPEKFFTPELLKEIDEKCPSIFAYGTPDVVIVDENDDE